ncbi:hypothetical protein BH10PSE2_BH10PSE2_13010 [soil metagenome]
MTTPDPISEPSIVDDPLAVTAEDQVVVIDIPEDGQITMTADAAEVSGIRLLDAADQARKRF